MFLPKQRNIMGSNRLPASKRMVCSRMIIRSDKRLKNDNSDCDNGKKANNKEDHSDSEDSIDRIFSNLKQRMLEDPSGLPPSQRKRKSGFDEATMNIVKKFKVAFDSSAGGSCEDRLTMGDSSSRSVVDFEKYNFGEDVDDKEENSISRKGRNGGSVKKTKSDNLKLVEEHLQDRIRPFVSIKRQGIFSDPIDRQNFDNKNRSNDGVDDRKNLEDSYRHIDDLFERYRTSKGDRAPKKDEFEDNRNGSSKAEARIHQVPGFEGANRDPNLNHHRCGSNNNCNNNYIDTPADDPSTIGRNRNNYPKCWEHSENSRSRPFDRGNTFFAFEGRNGNFNTRSADRGSKFLFFGNRVEDEEVVCEKRYGGFRNFEMSCNRNFIGSSVTAPIETQNFCDGPFGRDESLRNVIRQRDSSRNAPKVYYRRTVREVFEFQPNQ